MLTHSHFERLVKAGYEYPAYGLTQDREGNIDEKELVNWLVPYIDQIMVPELEGRQTWIIWHNTSRSIEHEDFTEILVIAVEKIMEIEKQ